jgi:plasmid stabilization system protein ParE
MAYKITWSAESKLSYLAILEYLESEWSEKEVINFVELVDNKLNLLLMQPAIGWLHNKRYKIRKTLVHKRVSLVYHVKRKGKEIVLLSFWDDRQDPSKLRGMRP